MNGSLLSSWITQTIALSLIVTKVIYILIDIYIEYEINNEYPSMEVKKMQSIRKFVLSLSELFIYVLFIIIFNPLKKNVVVRVTRYEQILLFIIGVLAVYHMMSDIYKEIFRKS
jgi:hypothetical protein